MTYLIGLEFDGHTALISDMRVTHDKGGSNTVLKSGAIAEGIVYAAAGNSFAIREFIKGIKDKLYLLRATLGRPLTLQENWQALIDRVAIERFDEQLPFDLIISSRHEGSPKLHILRSTEGVVHPVGDFVTAGSGADHFDPALRAFSKQVPEYLAQATDPILKRILRPYLYCHWLTEHSLGFFEQDIEDVGVGGVFHFVLQSKDGEARQAPVMYVACEEGDAGIECYRHRLHFLDGLLVFEEPSKRGQPAMTQVIVSDTEAPQFVGIDADYQAQWERYIDHFGDATPPAYTGILLRDPARRRGLAFFYSNVGKRVWHPETGFSEGFKGTIKELFADDWSGGAVEVEKVLAPEPTVRPAQGFERLFALVVPCGGARCLFEVYHPESRASFRGDLLDDEKIMLTVRDADEQVLFLTTDVPVPIGRLFCLGFAVWTSGTRTTATGFVDGKIVGVSAASEAFRFVGGVATFEDWTNRSQDQAGSAELGLLRMKDWAAPVPPNVRRHEVQEAQALMEHPDTRLLWFMPGAYGRAVPPGRNMDISGAAVLKTVGGARQEGLIR